MQTYIKNPKPKRKPTKYLETYEQKQKASSLVSIYFGSPGLNHAIKTKLYETFFFFFFLFRGFI